MPTPRDRADPPGLAGDGGSVCQLAYLVVGDVHEPAGFLVVVFVVGGGGGGPGGVGEADSGQPVAADLVGAGGGVHRAGYDHPRVAAVGRAHPGHGHVQQLGHLVRRGLGGHLSQRALREQRPDVGPVARQVQLPRAFHRVHRPDMMNASAAGPNSSAPALGST